MESILKSFINPFIWKNKIENTKNKTLKDVNLYDIITVNTRSKEMYQQSENLNLCLKYNIDPYLNSDTLEFIKIYINKVTTEYEKYEVAEEGSDLFKKIQEYSLDIDYQKYDWFDLNNFIEDYVYLVDRAIEEGVNLGNQKYDLDDLKFAISEAELKTDSYYKDLASDYYDTRF